MDRGPGHAGGMIMSCIHCLAPLDADDGHDQCPSCLGVEHLREGMTTMACLHCTCLSLPARAARLARLEGVLPSQPLTPRLASPPKRRRSGLPPAAQGGKRRKADPLAHKVDALASEFAGIKTLLLSLQPAAQAAGAPPAVPPVGPSGSSRPVLSPAYSAQEDVLSTRASEGLFLDQACGDGGGGASHSSHTISLEGERSTLAGSEASQMSVRPALKVALARLGLDAAPSVATPPSAFFRGASRAGEFCVPPSAPFLEELQSCWADPRRLTRPSQSARALASMSAASSYGLDRMPDIEPSVAALVLSPGEALRPDARCPQPQCRLTDDHIVRGYNTAARMGRIGNSMSHLILALSQTLQASDVDPSVRDLSDASLQAFGFMTRELGRLMSSLTLARRQIWLAQSPLLEPYRRALRTLPVVPGELFGPAAQQALERSLQVTQAREQFSSLRRGQPGRLRPPAAAAVPLAVPRPFSRPPVRRSERFHRQAPAQTPPAAQREQPARRRPYRFPRGRGGRP